MTTSTRRAAVVLAAGRGTRMASDLPKVCHVAAGKTLVQWVVEAAMAAGCDPIVVIVGYGAEQVKAALADYPVRFAVQDQQLGTGHATAAARKALAGFEGLLVVANGDGPMVTGALFDEMCAAHEAAGAKATLLAITPTQPLAYGRIIRAADQSVIDVVEEKDCTPEQAAIRELNAGTYVFWAPEIWAVLASLDNRNKSGEYYVTDVARRYGQGGEKVIAVAAPETAGLGVNTPEQLQQVSALLRQRDSI